MTTVLITGCSSGIGRALAHEFHSNGCQVIATARRLNTLQDLEAVGISIYELDVTNTEQVAQVVEHAIATHHRIDILINNAGYGLMGPVLDLSPKAIEQQFSTNVFAPIAIARAIAPHMRQQDCIAGKRGLIVNIGSISGIVPTPFAGAYCASKAALHAFTETLRMELAGFDIQVVLVQPGAVQSSFGTTATAKVKENVKQGSWYGKHADAIRRRANASQVDATPVEAIAQTLVRVLLQLSPPAIIRLGKKSLWLPLVKQLLATALFDRVLKKRFDL